MKGQEWIGGLFSLLLAGIIAGIALPSILPGQELKITPQVEAKEFENKAIVIANSLIGNQELLYLDGTGSYQTGVFDKKKLDDAKSGKIKLLYPEACVDIEIKDKEKSEKWSFSLKDEPNRKCTKRSSTILDRGFPVAIKFSDVDVRIGVITVKVME